MEDRFSEVDVSEFGGYLHDDLDQDVDTPELPANREIVLEHVLAVLGLDEPDPSVLDTEEDYQFSKVA